jgi:cyclophilin family peptidyl-prolyl cis-trans isomerase
VRQLRDQQMVSTDRRGQDGAGMSSDRRVVALVLAFAALAWPPEVGHAQIAGPVIVVETTKGAFAFETYPSEAPKTVAHILQLVRNGFYDGQRFHRALTGFVAQWGDPRSRDPERQADWGRGDQASSGTPIGAPEISRKHLQTRGAVAVAHDGDPAKADSQIYVTLADRPDLNGRYTVFGHVVAGNDVPERIRRGDLITRMYVRE